MPTEIQRLEICPGMICEAPSRKLLAFLTNEWELYDGVAVARDDTVTLSDILLSIMMNSRLATADQVKTVWEDRERRAAAEAALGRIPPRSSLLDEEPPYEALADLFNAFCGIRGVGEAVATKILHKKRPELIPIIDSVLVGHFLKTQGKGNIPKNCEPIGTRLVANLHCFRRQILGCLPEIESLCEAAKSQDTPVSPVRALEILIWIEREPRGYYRNLG